MAENRFAGWATLALMLASFVTAQTEAGPLLDMFSRHHYQDGYSPLHYWLPGVYRLNAYLQPLPPDSPPRHLRSHHGNPQGDGSDSQPRPQGADIPSSAPLELPLKEG